MTNQELLAKARALAGEERRIAAEVIELLREIDRRLLYAEMGYASLYEFCEKELGYSNGAAARRIASMRLAREMPETKELLKEGKLSLETMHAVQVHFNKEKPTEQVKKEIINAVLGKSKREVERIIQPEKTYTIVLTEKEFHLLQELRVRLGTSNIEKILTESLRFTSPAKWNEAKSSTTRHIPRGLRTAVFKRDNATCAWPGCKETRNLQFDHVQPFAQGGATSLENLRLLCPGHNRLHSFREIRPHVR